jgi:hypothetical protein
MAFFEVISTFLYNFMIYITTKIYMFLTSYNVFKKLFGLFLVAFIIVKYYFTVFMTILRLFYGIFRGYINFSL